MPHVRGKGDVGVLFFGGRSGFKESISQVSILAIFYIPVRFTVNQATVMAVTFGVIG